MSNGNFLEYEFHNLVYRSYNSRSLCYCQCGHNEYESVGDYVLGIRQLVEKHDYLIKHKRVSKAQQIGQLAINKIHKGVCQNCAVYTTANVPEIMNLHCTKVGTNYNAAIAFYHISALEVEIRGNYHTHYLKYPSLAKYAFTQSDLWMDILDSYVQCVSMVQGEFTLVAVLSQLLIVNAHLFDHYHFTYLLKYRPKDKCCWFEKILNFMEYQLEHGDYADDGEGIGSLNGRVTLICMRSLIVQAAHYLTTCLCTASHLSYTLNKLIKWLDKIKDKINGSFDVFSEYDFTMKQSMIALTEHSRWALGRKYYIHRSMATTFWNQQWNDMKCANIGCKVLRKDNGKLYKCKRCKVVRYCSRKCQKVDWNKNNHKENCGKFRKMTKNRDVDFLRGSACTCGCDL